MRLAIVALTSAIIAAAPACADERHSAADLHARCTADMNVCRAAVHWIIENTGACILAGVAEDEATRKTYVWLGEHPGQMGRDDNDLAGYAISSLWPCQ